jgi:pimeloyl-ACP methyl ester carboxylesterase
MPITIRDHIRIRYEVLDVPPNGANPPATIVFHHGVAFSLDLWNDWLPQLADRYRLVRFDMRGCGRSDLPDPASDWSLDALAQDVLAVAAAVGAPAFHFVGESLGGTLGLHMGIHHPDRLLSLTVSNGSPRGRLVQNLAGWKDLMDDGGLRAWSAQMMEWRFFPDALAPAQRDWALQQHLASSGPVSLAIADLLAATDLSADLDRIRVPTLLLCPDASPFIPVTVMAEMKQRIADAELQVFAHTRHGLPLSHGRESARVLRDFLERRGL